MSNRSKEELEGVSLLGQKGVEYLDTYTPDILESFINKHQENDYMVKLQTPEFTSLCPMTGQPDFATVYIQYIPDVRMVESKSLKLYLFSFRNSGDFHEDVINIIGKDLVKLLDPRYLQVTGKFTPRGGISIDPTYFYGRPSTKYELMAEERLMGYDMMPEPINNRG